MKKVITYGTFDFLHYGHIRLLKRAKELGDYLIVGVTAGDFDKVRGKINVQQSLMERIEAVRATGLADEIIVEEYEGQKIDDIKRYDIDVFTVGSDWIGKFDYLKAYCSVIYLERTEGISSTELRSKIRKKTIAILGNLDVRKKFADEICYVNGVKLIEGENATNEANAIYIASMPQRHYHDVKNALLNGKHVICESPIAIDEENYLELKELARNKNLILADSIKTAYATAYERLLVLAKSGCIGDVISVDSVCTSLERGAGEPNKDLSNEQNSLCAWGPIAMLPVFQLLGTSYKQCHIVSHFVNENEMFDGFTSVNFLFDKAVASIKVAKTAKAEGELIITGTKGYIYVPAPWWKTDYFEVRFENQTNNKRYFYQLDGDGIRYEMVAFSKAIENGSQNFNVEEAVSQAIVRVIDQFYRGEYQKI